VAWSVTDSVGARVVRGVVVFAAAAVLLGGIAGTLQWPIVGTFFAALEAAPWGVATGVFIALVTSPFASRRWAVRAVGGLTSGGLALGGLLSYAGPLKIDGDIGWTFVVVSAGLGVVLAPMVASGLEITAKASGASVGERFAAMVRRGAVIGSILGAAVGLVVGLFAFAPTAPFALVEGGIFGTVMGVVFALLMAAAVLLPRIKVLT